MIGWEKPFKKSQSCFILTHILKKFLLKYAFRKPIIGTKQVASYAKFACVEGCHLTGKFCLKRLYSKCQVSHVTPHSSFRVGIWNVKSEFYPNNTLVRSAADYHGNLY